MIESRKLKLLIITALLLLLQGFSPAADQPNPLISPDLPHIKWGMSPNQVDHFEGGKLITRESYGNHWKAYHTNYITFSSVNRYSFSDSQLHSIRVLLHDGYRDNISQFRSAHQFLQAYLTINQQLHNQFGNPKELSITQVSSDDPVNYPASEVRRLLLNEDLVFRGVWKAPKSVIILHIEFYDRQEFGKASDFYITYYQNLEENENTPLPPPPVILR